MTDKNRIKQYLLFKGISKNKFYEQTGLSVGFLDSGNSLGVDKARIIINKYPDINLEWLIMGTGEMINDPNDSSKSTSTTHQSKPIVEVKDETDSTVNQLLTLIREQSVKIESLSRENGKLQERIYMITTDLRASGGGGILHSPKTISPSMDSEKPSSPADNPQR